MPILKTFLARFSLFLAHDRLITSCPSSLSFFLFSLSSIIVYDDKSREFFDEHLADSGTAISRVEVVRQPHYLRRNFLMVRLSYPTICRFVVEVFFETNFRAESLRARRTNALLIPSWFIGEKNVWFGSKSIWISRFVSVVDDARTMATSEFVQTLADESFSSVYCFILVTFFRLYSNYHYYLSIIFILRIFQVFHFKNYRWNCAIVIGQL